MCSRFPALSLGIVMLGASECLGQSAPDASLRTAIGDLGSRVNTIISQSDPSLAGMASTPESGAFDPRSALVILGLEVSALPMGTSTGAFTYTFDTSLGTYSRSTQTYGPSFSKRSITGGKRILSAGGNWLHANYNSLDGFDLHNGDYKVGVATGLPIGSTSLALNLTSDTFAGFAAYGLTDRFDVGVGIPFIRVSLEAEIGFHTPEGVDITPGGHLTKLPKVAASGIGDIAVFGKYHFWGKGLGGLATEVEMRFPTGDTENLRGAGVTRTTVSAIWSLQGKLAPHANVGYEFWSKPVVLDGIGDVFARDQIHYAFGLEVDAHPQATVLLDIVGRRLRHGGQSEFVRTPVGPNTFIDFLTPVAKSLDVVAIVPGVKWNVEGNVLLTVNMLTSLQNRGLRANVIPVVGVEWAF